MRKNQSGRAINVYVLLGLHRGRVHMTRTTNRIKEADKIERKLCRELGVPYDAKERKLHRQQGGLLINDVRRLVLHLEAIRYVQ